MDIFNTHNSFGKRFVFKCENQKIENVILSGIKTANEVPKGNSFDFGKGFNSYLLFKAEKVFNDGFDRVKDRLISAIDGFKKDELSSSDLWFIAIIGEYFSYSNDFNLINKAKDKIYSVLYNFYKSEQKYSNLNFPEKVAYFNALKVAGAIYGEKVFTEKADTERENLAEKFSGESDLNKLLATYFNVVENADIAFDNYAVDLKTALYLGNLFKLRKYKEILDIAEKLDADNGDDVIFPYISAATFLALKKCDLYFYSAFFKDKLDLYGIFDTVECGDYKLKQGESKLVKFGKTLNPDYNYSLKLVGEVDFVYSQRFEGIMPMFYRKLDDSVKFNPDGKTLLFNAENVTKERTCYCMLRDGFKKGLKYSLSIRSMISGLNSDFTLSAEIYYGKPKTRFYYEKADETVLIKLPSSNKFVNSAVSFTLKDQVDFIVIKIDATSFTGDAELYAPILTVEGKEKNLCYDFDYCPEDLVNFYWIGEGFSLCQRPKYKVVVNGKQVFSGRYMDRLQSFGGATFDIPFSALKEKDNEIEIFYDKNNVKAYLIKRAELRLKPKNFELLGVKSRLFTDKEFGVFTYAEGGEPQAENSEYFDFEGFRRIDEKYGVLKFFAKKTGSNIPVTASLNGVKKSLTIASISQKAEEFIITGTGDFIYVNQSMEEFAEYLSWYLKNDVGDLFTFRSVYHWGATEVLDESFWRKSTEILSLMGMYYPLMHDGRELNGLNSSPDDDVIDGKYYLGQQTHERDGAFIYWEQNVDRINEFYYHLLSRKMKHNGIYGKRSPVYDKKGTAKIYYAPDEAENVKQAYEKLKENLRYTGADGAKRHTGVSTMFRTFFEAGYNWIGYESMYGPHELMLGAIRGASKAYGKTVYGTHLALQWSSVPTDDVKHFLRYRLSLYLSYMHGVSEINTEEGLWRIENPFADFDNFSYSCIMHRREQTEFNKFIQTHVRRGKIKTDIAMLIGKYDGMECFSSPYVFGQEKWKQSKPEESWNLLKVFYPESDLNAIYYYIRKYGEKDMPEKDRELLKVVRKGMYRDIIDYKQVGFYTNTPYGVIDIIPVDAGEFNNYKCLFFTGWNTADEEQIKKLCEFVENGGKLLLSKPHLYTTVDREKALNGTSETVNGEYVDKLLNYAKEGKVKYFDKDAYPIEYKEEYEREIRAFAEEYVTPYIKDTKYLSYTEYQTEDGASIFYLLNINWWDNEDATYTLRLNGESYFEKIEGCDLRVLTVKDNFAVYSVNKFIDVEKVENSKIYLSGFGLTEVVTYGKNGKRVYTVCVNGKTVITVD